MTRLSHYVDWDGFPIPLLDLAPIGPFRVMILEWKDGDTFLGDVNLGLHGARVEAEFRLANIDTPELNRAASRSAASKAFEFVNLHMPYGTFCVVSTQRVKTRAKIQRSLTRYIADNVWFRSGGFTVDFIPILRAEQERTKNWGYLHVE